MVAARWRSKRLADRLATWITREPYHNARNPWMEHDGTEWAVDPVWDKCYPKFPGPTKEEAIGQYWDYYYEEAEEISAEIGDIFRIFPTDKLNLQEHQTDILNFCGIVEAEHIYTDAHIHKSAKP